MTVCIAAIYNDNAILAASDRMVTGGYGDTTFEPPTKKIFALTNSIAALTAGDQSIQIQVLTEVRGIIDERIKESPEKWIAISEAAKIYSNCYLKIRNEMVERSVLSKYGLKFDAISTYSKNWSDAFTNSLLKEIDNFLNKINRISTLITGVDETGPHIYVVQGGEINCQDKIGFAAIGVGSNHALSHFMLSLHARTSTEPEALLTIHQAKKKSEISPGVGKATDLCVIGPAKGSLKFIEHPPFPKNLIEDLDRFYADYVSNIKKIDLEQKNKIQDYLNSLGESDEPVSQKTPPEVTHSKKAPPRYKKVVRRN